MSENPVESERVDLLLRRPETLGAAPGSVIIDPEAAASALEVVVYDAARLQEMRCSSVDEVRKLLDDGKIIWVNVEGLGSEAIIRGLGELFHLHPLALEDAVNVHQRPKVDRFGDHTFITARIPRAGSTCETEQLGLFLGKNFVLTFLEDPGDCFDPVRRRLRESDGLIRSHGADYLAYALLDASVDAYFPLLEEFGETLESLEDEVIEKPSPAVVGRIHDAKHRLRAMRRFVWPLREAMNELARNQIVHVSDETRVYFRDLYDHTVQIIDLVETYREMGADLTDLYLSSLSNHMNEIMRVLTVIATIFMPLSFIVGIYGMNFNTAISPWNMPELNWEYGYEAVWGVLLLTTCGMLVFFWRRGWLGRQATGDRWQTSSDDR